MNSTGDQFFLPDNSQFYFQDLPGEKYLRYVPNTDHSMNSPTWWRTCSPGSQPLPRTTRGRGFTGTADHSQGTMRVRVADAPTR